MPETGEPPYPAAPDRAVRAAPGEVRKDLSGSEPPAPGGPCPAADGPPTRAGRLPVDAVVGRTPPGRARSLPHPTDHHNPRRNDH